MTPNPIVPALIRARAGQTIYLTRSPRPVVPRATPRPRPATWHLGSRGVWKERRVKTLPA